MLPVRRLGLPDRSTADLDLIAAARDERTLQHDGSRVLAQAVAAAQLRVNNGVERIDRDRSLGPVPSLIAGSGRTVARRAPRAGDRRAAVLERSRMSAHVGHAPPDP